MGRPRKPKEKSPNINFRTNGPEDHAAFFKAAKKAGLKLPALIRLKLFGTKPKPEDRVPTPEEELQIKTLEAMQQIVKNSAALVELAKSGYSIPENPLELIRSELRQIKHKLDTFRTKSDILSKNEPEQ